VPVVPTTSVVPALAATLGADDDSGSGSGSDSGGSGLEYAAIAASLAAALGGAGILALTRMSGKGGKGAGGGKGGGTGGGKGAGGGKSGALDPSDLESLQDLFDSLPTAIEPAPFDPGDPF